MPVPSHIKAQRREARAQHRPYNGAAQYRRGAAGAFSGLMQPYGTTPKRFDRDPATYRYYLDNLKIETAAFQEHKAYLVRRQIEQAAALVPVALADIRCSWVWEVSFHVLKPKKRKTLWDDLAQLISEAAPAEVERAVQLHCQQHGWQLLALHGARPVSIAFAFHRHTLAALSEHQEQVIPWPAAFGQMEPPARPRPSRAKKPAG
jgi:hypothetical protein